MKTRLTKQTIDTLRAIGDTGAGRETLARRLAIPYSSACGRVRRMRAAELIECHSDGLIVLTDEGFDMSNRGAR